MLPRSGPSARTRLATRLALVGLGASGLLALAFACGPGDLSGLTNGRREAGLGLPCGDRAVPPPKPSTNDAPDLPQVTFAFDAIRIDTSAAADSGVPAPQGLDLDSRCNCVEPPSCIRLDAGGPAPSTCTDGGRDDVTGPLLASLSGLTGITPSALQRRLREGIFTILITVAGWNGTDSDPMLTAMVMTSPGVDIPEGGVRFAAFDGTDVWNVDPAGVVNGRAHEGEECTALKCIAVKTALDFQAYVANGVLVAHFAQIPLVIVASSSSFTLPFVGATLVAKISRDSGGLYHLAGELAGRMPAKDVLATTSAIENPIDNSPVCQGSESYNIFKSGVCLAADLQSDPGLDDGTHSCDALSEAVSFTAITAHLGSLHTVIQPDAGCPPVNDSCNP